MAAAILATCCAVIVSTSASRLPKKIVDHRNGRRGVVPAFGQMPGCESRIDPPTKCMGRWLPPRRSGRMSDFPPGVTRCGQAAIGTGRYPAEVSPWSSNLFALRQRTTFQRSRSPSNRCTFSAIISQHLSATAPSKNPAPHLSVMPSGKRRYRSMPARHAVQPQPIAEHRGTDGRARCRV